MNEQKPLLFIQSATTDTQPTYQALYDSRTKQSNPHIKKLLSEKLMRKINLLHNRSQMDLCVLCTVYTNEQQYRGLFMKKSSTAITVKDDEDVYHTIKLTDIQEIRINKI